MPDAGDGRRTHALARRTHATQRMQSDAQVFWSYDDEDSGAKHGAAAAYAPKDKPKGHAYQRAPTALDRFESWLGLKDGGSASRSAAGPSTSTPHRPASPSYIHAYVHVVEPSDTLAGIALRYGTDVPAVRRANALWTNSVAQMRQQLYIPAEPGLHGPEHAATHVCQRSADGSLTPFHGVVPPCMTHDPGISGVDDLLQLQEQRRSAVATPEPAVAATASAPPDAAQGEAWRPNVWTFGARAERPEHGAVRPPASPPRLADLMRGPPSNPGAAANWVRPIHWGESLPPPRGAPKHRTLLTNLFAEISTARTRVEDAVDAAVHDLRSGAKARSSRRSAGGAT